MPADAFDPYWLRGAIALGLALFFSATFFIQPLRKHFLRMVYIAFGVCTFWMIFLLAKNGFRVEYQVQYFIFCFTAAIIFNEMIPLLLFGAINILFGTFALIFSPMEGPEMIAFLGILFYIILSTISVIGWRIRKKRILEKQVDKDRIITETAFESSKSGIMLVDSEGRVLRYNKVFLDMWDVREAQLDPTIPRKGVEIALLRLKNPEVLGKALEEISDNPEDPSYALLEFKDGKIVEQYQRPFQLDSQLEGRLWYFRDVTKEKRDEQNLKENLELLNAVFELAGVGILVTSNDNRVINYNEECLEIFNLKAEFVEKTPWKTLLRHCKCTIDTQRKTSH